MKLTATLIALAAAKKTIDTRVPKKPNRPNKNHTTSNTVVSDCGGSITANNTVITSPGFYDPGYYYNNVNCVWNIEIPGALVVTVIPEHFAIEGGASCPYDKLTIYDGSGNSNTFCGVNMNSDNFDSYDNYYDSSYYYSYPDSYYSYDPSSSYNDAYSSSGSSSSSGYTGSSSSGYYGSSSSSSGRKRRSDSDKPENLPRNNPMFNNHFTTNNARIEFTSDYIATFRGFKLRIVTGAQFEEDSCVQILERSGVVTSPEFPDNYENNAGCTYTLLAEPGKNIKLKFTDFDIEENSSNCGSDALVIDGTRYCGSYDSNYALAPAREMVIQSDRTVIDFLTDDSVTRSGFRFEWESVDSLQEPAVFWAHMQEFYDLTKAQMESGEYERPWRVPYFRRMFNRVVRGGIEDYSQLTGECNWNGQQPTYEEVEIKHFDENQNRCSNLIRMSEMGLQYIDSYVCMEGHTKPNGTLKRWKMWMNKIRDMGREFCGLNTWATGPVSLPPGLTCPAPENPFQQSESANRIVGGQAVAISTWPWIVDLNGCGGSIISKNPSGQSDWILTAAHCCEWSSRIEVKVASFDQDPWDMSTGEFNVFSSRIIIHPDYRGESSLGEAWGSGNDICLLEVPNLTDAQYDEWGPMSGPPSWSPVCLPSAHAEPGQFCYVAGWGTTSYGGSASQTLRDVGVNIFSHEQCIATAYGPDQIKDSEFCAGVPDLNMDGITDGGRDSCQGDSGGPLVCQEGSTAVQYGVVSWGYDCAAPNKPGVYAKLAGALTEWIYEQMNEV